MQLSDLQVTANASVEPSSLRTVAASFILVTFLSSVSFHACNFSYTSTAVQVCLCFSVSLDYCKGSGCLTTHSYMLYCCVGVAALPWRSDPPAHFPHRVASENWLWIGSVNLPSTISFPQWHSRPFVWNVHVPRWPSCAWRRRVLKQNPSKQHAVGLAEGHCALALYRNQRSALKHGEEPLSRPRRRDGSWTVKRTMR